MYLHNISSIKYSDPWLGGFEKRLDILKRGNRRVAYYYEKPDSSTFRYRVYNMIQSLNESNLDISASYFFGEELQQMEKIVSFTSVIVICRARYTEDLSRFITMARYHGKKVFFDIDDLVFSPNYTHLVVDSLNGNLRDPLVADFWFAVTGRHAATLNLCDEIITTNAYLADRISEQTGKKVSVIPNFMNREQIEISTKIFEAKRSNDFKRDRKFHLGYFSGSPTHARDLAVALDALIDLMDKHKNLYVRVVGYMDLLAPLQRFSSRIERFSMQDFINLQRLIGDVEINLVPLQDNEFTNCKSELKYFEAGVTGTVTIASPTFTYKNAIQHGGNGFLAKSYEWHEIINALVVNPDALIPIAVNAHFASVDKYSWKKQKPQIIDVLFR